MAYEDLEELLHQYNWDDGFEIPKAILDNPHCDLALPLKVFYLCGRTKHVLEIVLTDL